MKSYTQTSHVSSASRLWAGSVWSGVGQVLFVPLLILLIFCQPTLAQEPEVFFKQFCTSCHFIGGGRLIGPDLQNVSQRAERDWLINFIADPKSVLDSGDPYAMKLKQEANGAVMINLPGMNRGLATSLIDLIIAESALDSSRFAGVPVQFEPFTAADIDHGFKLFSGVDRLSSSGPACISCHTCKSARSTLGGQLGPNLTRVFERLQGRLALTAWLGAPPTVTMKSVFGDHKLAEEEINALVAYFESASGQTVYNFDLSVIWLSVILCGLGGSVFGLVVFGSVWEKRFRSVRCTLVNSAKNQR